MDDVVETTVTGAIIEVEPANAILLLGHWLPDVGLGKILYQGCITLRAALAFFYTQDALVVNRVVDDFGRDYRGDDAFEFILRKGDSFPRSDVFGRRIASGAIDQVFLKQLDVARGVQVFAYKDVGNELLAHISTILFRDGQQASEFLPSTILSGVMCEEVSVAEMRALRADRKTNF